MCNQAVDNYVDDALEYVSDQYKTQQMCDKAVNIHPSVIQFVPACFKTQAMCDKAVDTCHFVFDSIPDQFKTQKMCNKLAEDFLCYNIVLIDVRLKKS